MADEVNELKDRRRWRVIMKHSLPLHPNIVRVRFFLTLKSAGMPGQKSKARYVAQGHRDQDKRHMVHNTTSLRQISTRIILSVAVIKGFCLFCHDVRPAYLQSEDKLTRQLFLLPKPKDLKYFGLEEDEILELLRPIYGKTDAGDY